VGASGELRGKTRIEVYLRYQGLRQDDSWDWHPDNKKDTKKAMFRDPQTGEWVLRFYAAK